MKRINKLINLIRQRIYVSPTTKLDVINTFHRLYYDSWHHFNQETIKIKWLGVETLKCPLDLWIYQEILSQLRPDLIIETGTYAGGSALFFANLFDLMGIDGRVISIDVCESANFPAHPCITYLTGSSISEDIVSQVQKQVVKADKVICFLDSDHTCDHVLKEMKIYAQFVTLGSYLIVEDTNINGHPVYPDFGKGPTEAVEIFIAENDQYEIDSSCERFLLTMNPKGYLKRVR